METYHLDKAIKILCVPAESFPDGVLAAHQKLHAMIPFSTERKYLGISHGSEQGTIIYKAAAEVLNEAEIAQTGLETFILKKGDYISINIKNYREDIPAIGKAFQELLANPDIDPNGVCVEWYVSDKDVQCMVRLDPEKL